MRHRWAISGIVVTVLGFGAGTATGPAGATPPTVVQSRSVPTRCRDTGAKFPFLLSLAAGSSGPGTVTTGDTLALRGITTGPLPAPEGAVSSVAVDQGGTSTTIPIDQWGPSDADVPITAAVGTLVSVRLTGSGFAVAIPDPPITFVRGCNPVDSGTFARWVVGGFACESAAGTGRYVGGLYDRPHLTPYFKLQVDATGCDVPGLPTVKLTATIPLHDRIACTASTAIPSAGGISGGTRGSGRLTWPDGTVSTLSLTASGPASAFAVELTGRITRGPHRGMAFGTDVTLTPATGCGSTVATRITTMDVATTRIVI
jgi:hypothetical protein